MSTTSELAYAARASDTRAYNVESDRINETSTKESYPLATGKVYTLLPDFGVLSVREQLQITC
jgi:hypothetical protein